MNEWNDEEIKTLRKYYRNKGAQYVATRLERSADGVMAKAAQLGIRYNGLRPWKEWEDRYLRRHYNDRKNISIARTLQRSLPSVLGRAKKLGLCGKPAARWTEKEKDILRSLYPDKNNSIEFITSQVNRSSYAVLLQAQILGISRPQHEHEWTKEEHQYFVKYRKKKSYKEIAQALGLSYSAVSHHASRSKLTIRPTPRKWAEEEKEYFRNNYRKIPTREIAAKLGRSIDAVTNYAGTIGISAGPPRPWTNEEKEYLKNNYKKIPIEQIAEKLGRSVKKIRSSVVRFKLSQPRSSRKSKEKD